MTAMRVLDIGFTKKPAQRFFDMLRGARVKRVLDVRLNNVSQLAGFAKRDDLAWFLREIGDIGYTHLPALAPTQALLSAARARLTSCLDRPLTAWTVVDANTSLRRHAARNSQLDPFD